VKVITIQISVPDGVEVRVNGGGQAAAGPQRPFVAQPDPAYPGGVCPEHGEEWNLVPAGLSKTKVNQDGSPKRYNAFWTCPSYGCSQKPPKPGVVEDVTGFSEADGMPF
jgi:hypothetical protein